MNNHLISILVCAIVTYLLRMIPLVAIKEKIKNRYVLSFMHYMPSTILAVMTIPSIFESTGNVTSAICAFIVAIVLAFKNVDMVKVAIFSSLTVLIIECAITYFC